MGQLERVSDLLRGDPFFSHDANGNPITREATCECGAPFVQTLLSERFLSIVERQSPRAIAAIRQRIPGFFVPVFCPTCERRDLGFQARTDEYKQEPRASYGDHADAAD